MSLPGGIVTREQAEADKHNLGERGFITVLALSLAEQEFANTLRKYADAVIALYDEIERLEEVSDAAQTPEPER